MQETVTHQGPGSKCRMDGFQHSIPWCGVKIPHRGDIEDVIMAKQPSAAQPAGLEVYSHRFFHC